MCALRDFLQFHTTQTNSSPWFRCGFVPPVYLIGLSSKIVHLCNQSSDDGNPEVQSTEYCDPSMSNYRPCQVPESLIATIQYHYTTAACCWDHDISLFVFHSVETYNSASCMLYPAHHIKRTFDISNENEADCPDIYAAVAWWQVNQQGSLLWLR